MLSTLKHAFWGNWPALQIIPGEAVIVVKELKEKEGKNMVLWGSISLVQSLIKEKQL